MKKFNEEMNIAVFTTRFVYREGRAILSVFHHEEDGAWEFISDDACKDDSDYLVIALEKIIKLDPTVLEIADLPLDWCAHRDSPDLPWQIQAI